MSPDSPADRTGRVWPADVDPSALEQPDGFSCGAATTVAARLLLAPGWRPLDVQAEILAAHRGLTSPVGLTGRSQIPWPRGLGTPPWAVANVLADLTGQRIDIHLARHRPGSSYDELVRRLATRPVAVYLGNAWLPRHVVLAYDGDATAVRLFDPAHGRLTGVPAGRWRGHRVEVAGWSHLWFVV